MTIFNPKFPTTEHSTHTLPVLVQEKCEVPQKNHGAIQNVMIGDCLDILPTIKTNSVDVVITSPPYNIGVAYRSYNDCRPRDEYLAWMNAIAAEIARVLVDDGAAYINLGAGPDPWIAADVAGQFRAHLTLQNRISWVKSIAIDDRTRGHFKPINSRRFLNRTHEEILHFTRHGDVQIDRQAIGVPYEDKSNISRWQHAKSDRRCAGNTWFIPYETVRSGAGKHGHPATFPLELPLRCLRMHGKTTGVVLDPFVGSGTTLVVAQRLGWNAIGIEIDEAYAAVALDRLTENSVA